MINYIKYKKWVVLKSKKSKKKKIWFEDCLFDLKKGNPGKTILLPCWNNNQSAMVGSQRRNSEYRLVFPEDRW